MLQQLNQPDTVVQYDSTTPETTQMIPWTSKVVPSKQVAQFQFSFPTPILFLVITEEQV